MKKLNTGAVRAAIVSTLLVAGAAAQAAVPTDVTDAITGAKADVTTVGAAVLVVIVAAAVFKWMRKAL
ncbi:major capsid protein [Aquabacterium sp.]|uniref:major capsid protein n=1 Tax=Aquabacterium sp. TaxID=1872578 RepID=UPI003783B888